MADPETPAPTHPTSGRWQMRSGSFDGEAVPDLVCENTELRITEGQYAFLLGGEVADAGELSWGSPGNDLPATLVSQAGPNKGRRTECRFSTRGQLLRMTCVIADPSNLAQPPKAYAALFARLPLA